MTRTCPNCGEPERRWTDRSGKPQVNLNSITGQCVRCLAAMTKELGKPEDPPAFDWQSAAANDRGEA